MPVIAWTESMSVGSDALDADHKMLIGMINGLGQPDADFVALFHALVEYTCGHFEREEAHLEAIDYPGLDSHRAQHDAFTDRVSDLLRQYRETPFERSDSRVADFLWTWLKSHILIEDMKYAAWTKARHTL
ncbi:conserved hypothetical protein [Candidatus Terasakiella magnetica]|nr:conserved hypothetical protein [Candidatus Terasakiella magnetica]